MFVQTKYPFYCVAKYLNVIRYFHGVETSQFSVIDSYSSIIQYNMVVCLETTLMKNAMVNTWSGYKFIEIGDKSLFIVTASIEF